MSEYSLSVVCFLWGRWGNSRGVHYVNRLYEAVQANLSLPHRFFCFTDNRQEERTGQRIRKEVIKAPMNETNGWKWNLKKMIMYSPDNPLTGWVLALDLDMMIVGPLDDLASYRCRWATCEGAFQEGRIGGSLIAFHSSWGNYEFWRPLVDNYDYYYKRSAHGSERHYYRARARELGIKPAFWQRIYPGQVVSYKLECNGSPPEDARVIRFHGYPHPHDVTAQWVRDYWKWDDSI